MGKRGWLSRLLGIITWLAVFCSYCAIKVDSTALDDSPLLAASLPILTAPVGRSTVPPRSASHSCPKEIISSDQFMILVSTLDGSLSALDMRQQGKILWSIEVDSRPLFSSSLDQDKRNGGARLIPSLDGSLFHYDGKVLAAVPMTAESLLSSSVRLNDNSVMVGGKEVRSFGVDVNTGQIIYTCSLEGCNEPDDSEVNIGNSGQLVVTRQQQTVRAVDVSSGIEKWNFSVGQHDVQYIGESQLETKEIEADDPDDDVTLTNCTPSEDDLEEAYDELLKMHLKVIVPEGKVIGLNVEDPSLISWQHKFHSPVAKAWLLYKGELEPVNLFDSKLVPMMDFFHPPGNIFNDPIIYIGRHKKQMYIQTSHNIRFETNQKIPNIWWRQEGKDMKQLPYPQVTWRPYLSTAGFRTPVLEGNQPPNIPLLGQKETKVEENGNDETSVAVWHENYPFDTGYYLFPQNECPDPKQLENKPAVEEDTLINIVFIPASLWSWWKEILGIMVLTSLVVHLLHTRFLHHPHPQTSSESTSQSQDKKDSSQSLVSNDSRPVLASGHYIDGYQSRFAVDFECLECLGRGGFGIVFRAKNKVDDQQYAVKRIALPKRENSKDKMLREVKVLAKLDHVGIVRFFNAWVESPPPGWQEERDKENTSLYSYSSSFTPTVGTPHIQTSDAVIKASSSVLNNVKPAKPVLTPLLRNILPVSKEDFFTSQSLTNTNSKEFSLHSNAEDFTDESGSFSFGDVNHKHSSSGGSKDCCSIVFQNSDRHSRPCKDASHKENPLPFSKYELDPGDICKGFTGKTQTFSACAIADTDSNDNSCSVVFEDSGCRDQEHSGTKADHLDSNGIRNNFQLSSSSFSEFTNNEILSVSVHPIDLTLSSHSGDERSSKLPEKDKEPDGSNEIVCKNFLYIQMQLCKQETLKDWLSCNTLNRERNIILDIFAQIVSAVEYVHSAGLIHRDLKPSNIFFAMDGTVKVGDFGLVTALAENSEEEEEIGSSRTGTHVASKYTADVGTQLYMSPEQVMKKAYDQKVDIFSLGLILLELMVPFSTGMERIITLQKARKEIFPERFSRELPSESELVKKLMARNPHDRPTATEILNHCLLQNYSERHINIRNRTISSSSSH